MLLAQQAALAHGFWHASAQAGTAQPNSPEGKTLCDLHDLLGTVLGGVGVAAPITALLSVSEPGFCAAAERVAQSRSVSPQSRGPPEIS